MTKTAAHLSTELDAARTRLEELKARRLELDGELDSARDDLGRATARGAGADAVKAHVRDLAEDLEATTRAIGFQNREIDRLDELRREAVTAEALSESKRRTAEARDAGRAVTAACNAFAKESAPLIEGFYAALQADVKAATRAESAIGGSTMGLTSQAKQELQKSHPKLFPLLQAVQEYAGAMDAAAPAHIEAAPVAVSAPARGSVVGSPS